MAAAAIRIDVINVRSVTERSVNMLINHIHLGRKFVNDVRASLEVGVFAP